MASRELKVEIIGDSKSLEHALGKSSQASSKFGSALKTLGKASVVAGAALGGALAVGAVKAVKAASDLQEQVNKANVVFAENGKEVIKWSKGLATSFGLSSRAALEAAGTFGNMLVPMGFVPKKAAEMSKRMTELGGDMASFNNASIEDTLLAIRSGLAGETEPLRKYGVFLSAARVQQEALRETGKKHAQDLTTLEKTTASYNIILKDTKNTQGDFARSAGSSLANQIRIAQASFENLTASIGTVLLPVVIKLMDYVNTTVIPVLTDWGDKLIAVAGPAITSGLQQLGPLFQRVRDTVVDLTHSAVDLFNAIKPLASTAFSIGISSFGQSAAAAAIAMLGFHAAMLKVIEGFKAIQAASAASALTSLLTPLGLATIAVGALAAAFVYTRGVSDDLSGSIARQRDNLKSLIDIANESVTSQDRLRDAKLGVKQATLNVTTAIQRRTELEKEGKKGTDEYKQAQLGVQQAYSARIRSEHELADAQEAVTKNSRDQGAAYRHLTQDAEAARKKFADLTVHLKQFGGEAQKKQVVTAYANEMARLSDKAERISQKLKDSNPELSKAASNFAKNAQAASDYAKRTGEIPPALGKVAPQAGAAGKRIGLALGQGIQAGINSTIAAISAAAANAVNKAEASARAAADAKSPSKKFEKLGKDMAEGQIIGYVEGLSAQFPSHAAAAAHKSLGAARAAFEEASRLLGKGAALKVVEGFRSQTQTLQQQITQGLKDAITAAIQKANQAVADARSSFASAFSSLADAALSAFDAAMAAWKSPTRKLLDKREAQRQEKELADAITKGSQGVTDATQALNDALSGGDPQQIKAAQDQLVAAQKTYEDALYASQTAALERQAAAEEAAHEKRVARQRIQLQQQLDNVQEFLAKHPEKYKEAMQRVAAILKKFGVDARTWGTAIGIALAQGLRDSEEEVSKAADVLAKAIARKLKLKSPAEEGPMSDLDQWWDSLIPTLMKGVDLKQLDGFGSAMAGSLAGALTMPSPAFVGALPGASALSSASSANDGIVELHTNVYLDSTQIAEVVRREYLRFAKRNGRSAV